MWRDIAGSNAGEISAQVDKLILSLEDIKSLVQPDREGELAQVLNEARDWRHRLDP
jgi:prephenate dehydrogenase